MSTVRRSNEVVGEESVPWDELVAALLSVLVALPLAAFCLFVAVAMVTSIVWVPWVLIVWLT